MKTTIILLSCILFLGCAPEAELTDKEKRQLLTTEEIRQVNVIDGPRTEAEFKLMLGDNAPSADMYELAKGLSGLYGAVGNSEKEAYWYEVTDSIANSLGY